MPEVEIRLTQKVPLKNHILIEGFPGIGLVGTIAAGYIVEKRKMEPIGYVYSQKFPPMTTVHAGRPYFPARIYKDPKGDFCVMLAEFVIPSTIVFPLAEALLSFAKQQGIKQIISLAGMTSATEEESKNIYGIASNDEMANLLTSKGIQLIKEGITTGVSGILLARSAVENFPAASLLAESKPGMPDPRASEHLIAKLDSLIGLKIDTKALLQEATDIEGKMKRLLDQMRKTGAGVPYPQQGGEQEKYPEMYG